jgi:ABC-2 type transport system permease protein
MNVQVSEFSDDLRKMLLSISFEMRKHFRRRRFLISMGIALFISLLFSFLPFLISAEFPETGLAFADSNLGFADMLIVIAAAIFAGDAISGEFEKKTGLLLFPTPQRRTTIYIGKFIAAVIPVILTVGVYFLATTGSIAVIYGFGDVPVEMLYSFLVAVLYSVSIVSIIYLFSSFMKRSIASSLVGFFLVMMILPITSMILNTAGVEPWFIVTYSGDLITGVLDYTGSIGGMGPGQGLAGENEPDTIVGLVVMIWYAFAGFIGGLTLAMRRRME